MDINNLDQAIRLNNKLIELGYQRQEVSSFGCFGGSVTKNKPATSAGVTAMLIVIDEQIAQAKNEVAQLQ